MRFRRSGRDCGVRIGGAEVRALGGVKVARWYCALCMLLLAVGQRRAFAQLLLNLRYTPFSDALEICDGNRNPTLSGMSRV